MRVIWQRVQHRESRGIKEGMSMCPPRRAMVYTADRERQADPGSGQGGRQSGERADCIPTGVWSPRAQEPGEMQSPVWVHTVAESAASPLEHGERRILSMLPASGWGLLCNRRSWWRF